MRRNVLMGVVLATVGSLMHVGCQTHAVSRPIHLADLQPSAQAGARTRGMPGKLSPDLDRLVQWSAAGSRGLDDAKSGNVGAYSPRELMMRFGMATPTSRLGVMMEVNGDPALLTTLHIKPFFRGTGRLYAEVSVSDLETLSADPAIRSIKPMGGLSRPAKPASAHPLTIKSRDLDDLMPENTFDHGELTGKGVIVSVIDTGIDWTHEDFINADGTSRILYLYDPFDNSFTTSNGAIGSEPPVKDSEGNPMGTLYTRDQISAALAGNGTVNSQDLKGHGTACAGTAAGNGRAAGNGIAPGTFKGVAPEADIIMVRMIEVQDSFPASLEGEVAEWIARTARDRHEPCVMSMSYGSPLTGHDGREPFEKFLDDLQEANPAGLAVCIAAGNDGRFSLHATSRFGPVRKGQADADGSLVQLTVKDDAEVLAYFDRQDEWVFGITGFPTKDGKNATLALWYDDKNTLQYTLLPKDAQIQFDLADFYDKDVDVLEGGPGKLGAAVRLPKGNYFLEAAGRSEKVASGIGNFYLLDFNTAYFGAGADKHVMVATPGNSSSAITVGSYDFRSNWRNRTGGSTYYNLTLGEVSDYSSAGFRVDGEIKPDIVAPGQYAISSAASKGYTQLTQDPDRDLTLDGKHIAWAGTSAACPYAAGVVALMLQKNPMLTGSQIKKILSDTADSDLATTGAVPNPVAGHGRINPVKAIAAAK